MTRQCARPGCSQPATATLTYDYRAQAAWLERLAAEGHPMTHDLCEAHADRLSVPQGWRLEDRRIVAELTQPAPTAPEGSVDAAAESAAAARSVGAIFRSQLAS
jgi:hypothetical protein